MIALSVKGLKKSYGDLVALEKFDLVLQKGEIFGLLGHNGAGKSTTIECILGVKTPDAGTVEILGLDPGHQRKQVFEKVSVQFQQSGYQAKIKVEEICELTQSLYGNSKDFQELLKTFGLADKRKRMVSELSGGERQKLSVLLALIPNPELVFLDELTTGLDPKARRDVWKHLQGLKQNGMTILLTSHYMDEVETLCGRIAILKKGQVVAQGTVAEVVASSPCKKLEEAYLWFTGEEEMEYASA